MGLAFNYLTVIKGQKIYPTIGSPAVDAAASLIDTAAISQPQKGERTSRDRRIQTRTPRIECSRSMNLCRTNIKLLQEIYVCKQTNIPTQSCRSTPYTRKKIYLLQSLGTSLEHHTRPPLRAVRQYTDYGIVVHALAESRTLNHRVNSLHFHLTILAGNLNQNPIRT